MTVSSYQYPDVRRSRIPVRTGILSPPNAVVQEGHPSTRSKRERRRRKERREKREKKETIT
ncbi:MAG: hypothetical protein LQ341_001186 [Variospora aurantia]|nr:MAG: hypothetical protein LQ341_001186 [Variospora aurantia]